jgi:hypothetical protein
MTVDIRQRTGSGTQDYETNSVGGAGEGDNSVQGVPLTQQFGTGM